MGLTRRDLLRYLLATPAAALVDYDKLLWVPKPIVVVPKLPPILMRQGDKLFHQVRAAETLHLGEFVEWVGDTYTVRKATTGGRIAGVAVAPVLDRGHYGFIQVRGPAIVKFR